VAEAKTNTTIGLSGRYATALFELAREAKALPAVEASLARFATALAGSADLAALMNSPSIARTDASKSLTAVAGTLELDGLTTKFLGTLANNRRLASYASVHAAFSQLMSGHRGETTATVTSAHALTEVQLAALKAKLKAGLGADVSLQTKVDPSILGGLIVKVGSKLIDSSLKTKLDSLSMAMKG
jgi:F-type H+-transporting ATPase subunit delta